MLVSSDIYLFILLEFHPDLLLLFTIFHPPPSTVLSTNLYRLTPNSHNHLCDLCSHPNSLHLFYWLFPFLMKIPSTWCISFLSTTISISFWIKMIHFSNQIKISAGTIKHLHVQWTVWACLLQLNLGLFGLTDSFNWFQLQICFHFQALSVLD